MSKIPNLKLRIAVVLVFVLSVACATSAWAVDYSPGVSVGQWVKYGNFVGIGTGSEDFNNVQELKIEVTAISGINVTLHETGEYKNKTDMKEYWYVANVQTGSVNGSTLVPWVIAANLNQGDAVYLGGYANINKTETRNYMGVSRSVNIFSLTSSTYEWTFVWDKVSGMMMEYKYDVENMKASFVAVDTNIFATGVVGWLMDNLIYIVIAVVVITVIATLILIRRKRLPTPPPPAEIPPPPPPDT